MQAQDLSRCFILYSKLVVKMSLSRFSHILRSNALRRTCPWRPLSTGSDLVVKVPVMGESITTGVMANWLVKVSDFVAADAVVASIETDKVWNFIMKMTFLIHDS